MEITGLHTANEIYNYWYVQSLFYCSNIRTIYTL